MPDRQVGDGREPGRPESSGPGQRLLARNRGFLRRRLLIAVAVAVPMAEAAAVDATAPGARALSPEATALAPLAVFHDLRWLFGLGGTWPRFMLTLLALVAARSVLDAVLAWLAWPRELARPRSCPRPGPGPPPPAASRSPRWP